MSGDPGLFAWVRTVGLVAGAALLWVQYFDLKDSLRPEPRSRQLAAFALGGLSAVVALGVFALLGLLGLPVSPGDTPASIAFFCFVLVGPIEEAAKFVVARTVVFRWDVFDEEVDGLVYASAVALGFASVENLLYLPHMEFEAALLRAVASPVTHAVFTVPWAMALARARVRGARPGPLVFAGLGLGMLAHGLYDHLLLAHHATYAAAGVVLLLWLVLIGRARGALRRDARRLLVGSLPDSERRPTRRDGSGSMGPGVPEAELRDRP